MQEQAFTDADALYKAKQPSQALRLIQDALKEGPPHAGLLQLRRQIENTQRQVQNRAWRVGLDEQRPVTLDFRDANLRSVLDVVTRHSGMNFVIDKDVRPDILVSIFVRNAKVEEVIDLLCGTNQLSKKVLDKKTVLIYPNTAEKQREYQEHIVKVFYLTNADAKSAAAFVKSMLKVRDPFVDERYNLLAIRDTAETIELADRMISPVRLAGTGGAPGTGGARNQLQQAQ